MAEFLIIDDERSILRSLELHIKGAGHSVQVAGTLADGHTRWIEYNPDLILLDLSLPDGDGLELLQKGIDDSLGGMVIIITGSHDLDKAMTAMRIGAFDFIHKPINVDELDAAFSRALTLHRERQRLALIADLEIERKPGKIVGVSRASIELHKQIGLCSRGKANVLIGGESGTGKELVARAIHRQTNLSAPFIPINCSAIVPTLLESELFGHERGAFTGANQQKTGRFELAGEGTIFLDEIADMELGMQTKLLRVIQEREFQRVGGTVDIPFSARIIAATNRTLSTLVSDGKFREDLYFRLKVVEIVIPPLRERRADIPDLVEHLLSRINRELRQNVSKVPEDFMDALQQYDFPGNIRELENILIAGLMRSTGDVLEAEVPSVTNTSDSAPLQKSTSYSSSDLAWKHTIREIEKAHIQRVLVAVKGHLGEACIVLGISRPTLRKKMEDYQLKGMFNLD